MLGEGWHHHPLCQKLEGYAETDAAGFKCQDELSAADHPRLFSTRMGVTEAQGSTAR